LSNYNEYISLQEHVEFLKAQVQSLQIEDNRKEQEIATLKMETSNLKRVVQENSKVIDERAEISGEISKLAAINARLEKEKKNVQSKLDATAQFLKNTEEKFKESQALAKYYKEELDKLKSEKEQPFYQEMFYNLPQNGWNMPIVQPPQNSPPLIVQPPPLWNMLPQPPPFIVQPPQNGPPQIVQPTRTVRQRSPITFVQEEPCRKKKK
jgi:hypothetical protein